MEAIKRHADAHGFTHPSTGVRLGAWLIAQPNGRPPVIVHMGITDRVLDAGTNMECPTGALVLSLAWDGSLIRARHKPFDEEGRWSALTLSGDLADEDEAEWCRVRKVYEDRGLTPPESLSEIAREDWCGWCEGTGIIEGARGP